ncbi:DUF2948 family protein [Bradyrhizobium sp. U87765 SZCCT0131]|uniref:DUF2948 family protein n=1 Tax=unclassified Bradyrhizobium TaxID=2631580 RepID=UPI001BACC718|nr:MULTISPECIES: DUF2948 family protein [unclassified Bradyrhizobium]MBR1220939.1 DUF2948 family protein [Bradyrhizobium sp. U87765 SZCCT0131]MBR1260241.1 DUF2948 family protein [Bradyrhizobium sp. U87765 SZCCT0134]MBR1307510.1 DUF2948 family protein [Bradyrhizobium sp. U87765 SZCCT0110]MBR1321464.1 DUF2948 family protein [Bradyrhizobium sp. U87765 SZCCT0109]MBR1349777.1 DUF2948 family protein [Bradyrhizobium sp. U87765 SZCCT0048]
MAQAAARRKLAALDADDLCVISAHVQDARVAVRDIVWRPREKRLVLGMRRLDWDEALDGMPQASRLVSALRFDRVLGCQARKIDLDAPQTVLELIGIEFNPGQSPSGTALLLFSGGGALRLELECLECELADLGIDADAMSETLGEAAPPLGPTGSPEPPAKG